MTKLKLIKKEEEEETFPIESMTGDEARNILDIMDYQQEMFLGGLNDQLMSTTLGMYTETKEQFEKILKRTVVEWNTLYAMVEKQEAND